MKKFIVFFVSLILTSSVVFASDFNVYKSDLGQTIIVKQVKSNPIVVIDTWINTGSINEEDCNSGVSHFLEHLFFKGTQKNPLGTFDKVLESKGAVTNAATSKDFTHYYIKLPAKYFDLALDLHADMLLNPSILQAEMDRERKVVLEEIAKDKNSPSEILYDNLNELIYKVHPYKRQVIGSSEVIKNITRDEIFDYYKKNYSPKNMITIVVGDVNPDETALKIKKAFSQQKYSTPFKKYYKKEPPITSQRYKLQKFPCKSGYMMIGFRGTNAVHKDSYALDILASILGNGRTSRFYQQIKEQKQLANSIYASNGSFKDDGVFYVNTNFQPENKAKLQAAIFEEIEKIKKYGVSQEEVQRAKTVLERETHYSRESISNVALEMGYTAVLTGNIENYDKYLEYINKVTANDVQRVAKKYLAVDKSAISVVVPENYTEPVIKNAETSVKNCSAKLITSKNNIDKYELSSKVTLIVNKHKNNDIVALSIRAKGGEFLEDKYGVANLMASTMLKGTLNYSQVELAKVLEENGIQIMPSSASDSFVVNVVTTKNELSQALELLNEIVNNACFDETELEKVRKVMLNGIKSNRDVPLKRAMEEYSSQIFAGSVYSNTNKTLEKTLPTIKRADVLKYYETIFYPENLVVSVNGDVDDKYIINKLSEIFMNKKGKKFDFNAYKNSIPPIKTIKKITTPIKDLQTAWIFMGWQTDGSLNQKEFATLQVIDAFLGTGMSSRLFINLREKRGLAYQVGSGFAPNVLKGKFTVYIGTNPTKLAEAKQNLIKQIQRVKTEKVSEEELQNAKDLLIGQYVLALETNLDKASALANYEATGRGFDFVDKYESLIQSVSAEDVIDIANKYFNDNYVESIVDRAK